MLSILCTFFLLPMKAKTSNIETPNPKKCRIQYIHMAWVTCLLDGHGHTGCQWGKWSYFFLGSESSRYLNFKAGYLTSHKNTPNPKKCRTQHIHKAWITCLSDGHTGYPCKVNGEMKLLFLLGFESSRYLNFKAGYFRTYISCELWLLATY